MLVNQKELSAVIGISTRQIRDLARNQGMFQTFELTKKYDLATCVQEYIRYKVECESGTGNADYEKERAEHERVKKEITKLKLRRMRRELHDATDVEAVVGDMLIRFRAKLLAVPAKLAPQLVGAGSASDIMTLLKREMREALEELADYSPDDFCSDAPEDDGDDDEDEATDDCDEKSGGGGNDG